MVMVAAGALAMGGLTPGCSGGSKSSSGVSTLADNASGERRELTAKEVAQLATPAIVRIEIESSEGGGFGTGFVLDAAGRIATNLHVINGASQVRVSLVDGTSLELEQVTAIDPERDLAIIMVRTDDELPTLPLGDSDQVAPGDPVIAIGNPLGVFDYTVSDGLISAVRPVTPSLKLLQISAPISQGSSGGPLFNAYGEVIGVAMAIAGQGQNLNFGIPSNYLRSLLARNEGLTLEAVTERMNQLRQEVREQAQQGQVKRRVPQHPLSLLKKCSKASVQKVVDDIRSAIEIGAPLYNDGNHEACFRVYEGTAIRLESELPCKGMREALGQGLLRASTEDGYTSKAWAMRDTFDGLLIVAKRKYPAMF